MPNNVIKNFVCLFACVATLFVAAPLVAADYACDDEDNMVNPALGLCSTHVYNIGATDNPANSGDKEMMKDVIALKTTVMTQQMYKQYEYLESMIKRFKTQLEKAVLTTKLQASGAGTGATSSSSYSGMGISSNSGTTTSRVGSNKYIVLNDAKNCTLESTPTAALQCLLDNISVTLSALDNNNVSDAKKQLDADKEVAGKFGVTVPSECRTLSNNVRVISSCAYSLRVAVMQEIENKSRSQNGMQGGMQRNNYFGG